MGDTKERLKEDAAKRRSLEGTTRFQDLGEPIQKLLQQVTKEITDEDLEMLSKITVRMLAKVFNMLALEEDPDKILLWLREEAKRTQTRVVDFKDREEANKNPIAFYAQMDKKHQVILNRLKNEEKEREEQRKANLEARRKRQEEQKLQAEKDRELAEKHGDTTDAVDRLKPRDVAALVGTFDRFSTKQSVFDNTNSAPDSEWWKRDKYRRDYEKNKRKGVLWTRVVEGGTQKIPESEMAVREEWYKSCCWWKQEKYVADWRASREAAWWKEEMYIKDWQANGMKGTMWLAADETTGFNGKGQRRMAQPSELEERVAWYRDNGPRGIVKHWCALTEGSAERCLLEEKLERNDYYKNGEWWKSDEFVRKALENPGATEGARQPGSVAADRDWWKDDKYRRDMKKKGKLWPLANEKAAVKGDTTAVATQAEQERRKEWYDTFWWKTAECIEDFRKNGDKGIVWRAATEEESEKAMKGDQKIKYCSATEAADREAWFLSCDDREWWKDPMIMRDWDENGAKGKKWMAGWQEAALESTGDVNRASNEEVARREKWYKENWWKLPQYVKDFQAHGEKGKLWTKQTKEGDENKEWWKQVEIIKSWFAARMAASPPFWMSPECVEDFQTNGDKGKKWTAANAAAATLGKGDTIRAFDEELEKRRAYFKDNWWTSEQCLQDMAVNGRHGKLWRAKEPGGKGGEADATELRRRHDFLSKKMDKGACLPFEAVTEGEAVKQFPDTLYASADERQKRRETWAKDWWKTDPAICSDFSVNGAKSAVLRAATPEVVAAGLYNDPAFQAPASDIKARIAFFENGGNEDTSGSNWWKDANYGRERAARKDMDFWKNPDCVEDYNEKGAKGTKWTASSAAAASVGKGDDPAHRAGDDELKKREGYYKENFWKAPKYQKDFETKGPKGTLWTMSEPNGRGSPIGTEELARRRAFFEPSLVGDLAEAPGIAEKRTAAPLAEVLDREAWMEKNWWKVCPQLREDFEANGEKGKLINAACASVLIAGLAGNDEYKAPTDIVKERVAFFQKGDRSDWWTEPPLVSDYIKHGEAGMQWTARNQREAALSMGKEFPIEKCDAEARKAFYEANYWKTSESIEDFAANGAKGKVWKADRSGKTEISDAKELANREAWLRAQVPVQDSEFEKRKKWMLRQLSDDDSAMRRNWLVQKAKGAKRIYNDELEDLLTQVNDGAKPTKEQVAAVLRTVKHFRQEVGDDEDMDGITQEEFMFAVADTDFYVPNNDEERNRAEADALDALQREEIERLDEVAGHLALEAKEEMEAAGISLDDADLEGEDEEAAFLDEMDEVEVDFVNEDDKEFMPEDEWKDALEKQVAADEEVVSVDMESDGDDLNLDEFADVDSEKDIGESEASSDDLMNNLLDGAQDIVEDDGGTTETTTSSDDESESESETESDTSSDISIQETDDATHKIPLPEMPHAEYLKAYFTTTKANPVLKVKTTQQWVVDHFAHSVYCVDKKGKVIKEFAANFLLQLERCLTEDNAIRMLFYNGGKRISINLANAKDRETFFETAQAIRPCVRVYAPNLTHTTSTYRTTSTVVDGIGKNAITVNAPGIDGKECKRELTGECKINASSLLTERLTVWTGSLNMCGAPPPKNRALLSAWIPQDRYDVYAIGVQEASYRQDELDWFDYVEKHMGKGYMTLGTMMQWDTLLIVMTRKKHLLKTTNVEGSAIGTKLKSVCGTKGGVGIAIRYLETSMCFVTCHLAARAEALELRDHIVHELFNELTIGVPNTDIGNQFHHVFLMGGMNYRVTLEPSKAAACIAAKNYKELLAHDQLQKQMKETHLLLGFEEDEITFPPTYRVKSNTQGDYVSTDTTAPSYCDRILVKSLPSAELEHLSYRSAPGFIISEHIPVVATFAARCVRTALGCFLPEGFYFNIRLDDVNVTDRDVNGKSLVKPTLLITSPVLPHYKPINITATRLLNFTFPVGSLPVLEVVSKSMEYVETSYITFTIREGSEKRDKKALRGSAILPLKDMLMDKEGQSQKFTIDVIHGSQKAGKLSSFLTWERVKE